MKKYILSLLTIFLVPGAVLAQTKSSKGGVFSKTLEKLGVTADTGGLGSSSGQGTELTSLISNLVNLTVGILGVVAVLLMFYAGGLWLTAAGNDDKVSQAKSIFKTTIVGIIVVGLSYAITTFIVSTVVGAGAG